MKTLTSLILTGTVAIGTIILDSCDYRSQNKPDNNNQETAKEPKIVKLENELVEGPTIEERIIEVQTDLWINRHDLNHSSSRHDLKVLEKYFKDLKKLDLEDPLTEQILPGNLAVFPISFYYSEEIKRTFGLCAQGRIILSCKVNVRSNKWF